MRSIRNRYLLFIDAGLLGAAPFLAYAIRFEGWHWTVPDRATALIFAGLGVPLSIAVFWAFGLYRRLWRYASIAELELIFAAAATADIVGFILGFWILPGAGLTAARVPLSVLFATSLLTFAIIGTPRLLMRIAGWRSLRRKSKGERRVLIAGAGAAGESIVRELRANPELEMEPVGFVDDDLQKQGMRLSSLPVLGPLSTIPALIARLGVTDILIAMPRAPGPVVREVVRAAFDAGVRTQIVPGLFEILSERVSVTAIREVQIDDLLRRDVIQTDLAEVERLASRRTVLVTGAGGSIGAELCRQLAELGPERLVVLGHGENPIFDITEELIRRGVSCQVVPVIADVRDAKRLNDIFAEHRPFAVFHAAAHKHVPLMESNVVEAITNNVLGTRNLVEAAATYGTQHFVCISTDKAVRPTNVMGATKRVAEFVVHNAAIRLARNFVSVRFGNVLGSQGSVVPTFVRQIKSGGPVTVTHPDMRRFFMTIPEAVQLVLQAGSLGVGGELFMLDMGEPVRVLDLARDMIRLSGLQEGIDIKIEFTGVRPGEKLYEEMFFSHEVAETTGHPKILRAKSGLEQYCGDEAIDELIQMAHNGADAKALRVLLRRLVPDFAERIAIMSDGRDDKHPRVSGSRAALTDAEVFLTEKKQRRASGQFKPID
ncbi:MAG TPA: nucleoside-diphosphate sugar epimerase/dehydratase [Thermoanaerobaculia bacterium]